MKSKMREIKVSQKISSYMVVDYCCNVFILWFLLFEKSHAHK